MYKIDQMETIRDIWIRKLPDIPRKKWGTSGNWSGKRKKSICQRLGTWNCSSTNSQQWSSQTGKDGGDSLERWDDSHVELEVLLWYSKETVGHGARTGWKHLAWRPLSGPLVLPSGENKLCDGRCLVCLLQGYTAHPYSLAGHIVGAQKYLLIEWTSPNTDISETVIKRTPKRAEHRPLGTASRWGGGRCGEGGRALSLYPIRW